LRLGFSKRLYLSERERERDDGEERGRLGFKERENPSEGETAKYVLGF